MSDAASPAFVVAVSASGGRTASLQQFLQGVGLGEDIAVVVVVQSREALDEAALKDGLRAVSREISPVEDGAPIEAGRIYLPAADLIISIEDGVFRTQPAEQDPGERGTIDSFLVSLAHDEERRAIAVALAGTTSAGTLGVKAIKVAGGIALAEETAESSHDELSKSSSPAALADDLLPIDGLVERVNSSIRYLGSGKGNGTDAEEDGSTKAALASIATVLRNKTGHDFHGYKEGTFLRRVQRRMQVL